MKYLLLLTTLLSWGVSLFAQSASLIEDLVPGSSPQDANPGALVQSGNTVYFIANLRAGEGEELWRTDGTEAGTALVHDLLPGPQSSVNTFLAEMADLNGLLYFKAHEGETGNQLWRTDGSVAGTYRVNALQPGTQLNPKALTALGNQLLFAGQDDSLGNELWVSDGTEAGTRLLKDINPGQASSGIESMVKVAGKVFFVADGIFGEELHVSDGTTAGTLLVKDIRPGGADALIQEVTAVGNRVFFQANDGTHGQELWVSDGTAAGTRLVKDLNPGSTSATPRHLTELQGEVYFSALTPGNGIQLWKSDGTETGTVAVTPGAPPTGPAHLYNVNDQYLVYAATDATHGTEIWKSDGTAAGTALWLDLNPGSDDSDPQAFVRVGNRLLFHATGGSQRGSWSLDEQGQAQFFLPSFFPETDKGLSFQGSFLFAHNDSASGSELWVSDGSPAGSRLLKNLAPDLASGNPQMLHSVLDRLYFASGSGVEGQLRAMQAGSSERLSSLTPFINGSIQYSVAALNQSAIISAYIETDSFPLLTSDGTAAGTSVLDERIFYAGALEPVGNWLVFITLDNFPLSLWQTDGTAAGTDTILSQFSFNSANYLGSPQGLYVVGDSAQVRGLWRYDPATRQIQLVFSAPLALGTSITLIRMWNGQLYFTAREQGAGYQLYRTDGTAAGTEALKELNVLGSFGGSQQNEGNFVDYQGALYFLADDGLSGQELWRTDGTPNGTVQVADLAPGAGDAGIRSLSALDNQLLFTRYTPAHGRELWVSDGTAAGTSLLKDILPGALGSLSGAFQPLVAFHNLLYFAANDGQHGTELWRTDGTESGTQLVDDLYPGALGSCPQELTVAEADSVLYFVAHHPTAGRELWAIGRTVGVDEARQPGLPLKVYPNPTRGQLNVELPLHAADQLEVLDLSGRVLEKHPLSGQAALSLSVGHLPTGFYLLRARQGGQVVGLARWVKVN